MVENCMDFNVSSWCMFYLECDKRRESSSSQVYIELCYSYAIKKKKFYKIKILSTICFNFGIESAFCHMTTVAIGR
jgi:hypothetical protein